MVIVSTYTGERNQIHSKLSKIAERDYWRHILVLDDAMAHEPIKLSGETKTGTDTAQDLCN